MLDPGDLVSNPHLATETHGLEQNWESHIFNNAVTLKALMGLLRISQFQLNNPLAGRKRLYHPHYIITEKGLAQSESSLA